MVCICCAEETDDVAAAYSAIGIRQSAQLQRPEWKITLFVFLEMFLASATSSVATVGVVWATVVLLGGFVSKLSPLDFFLVKILTLFLSMRIFGGNWNPDQKILYGFLDKNILQVLFHRKALTELHLRICSMLLWLMEALLLMYTPSLTCILFWGKAAFLSGAFVVAFLKNTVLLVTVIMSVTHLFIPNLGNNGAGTGRGTAETANMRASIVIFYGVATAQSVLTYLLSAYSQARPELLSRVSSSGDYRFDNIPATVRTSGDTVGSIIIDPLNLYYIHLKRFCRDGRLRSALDMNLPTFAVQCLRSDEREVRLSGLVLMNGLTNAKVTEAFRQEAIAKLEGSHDAVESLFRMMAASTGPPSVVRWERKMAASLVAHKLPGGSLRVVSAAAGSSPSAMRSVCSLLEATRKDSSGMPDEALVWMGLRILEKLSAHVCNLSEISGSHELMASITALTAHTDSLRTTDVLRFRKVRCALTVFAELAGAMGKEGSARRQDILGNVFLLSNVREILQNPSVSHVLRELALRLVDAFALDHESRNCSATRKMVAVLLTIFCSTTREGDGGELVQFQLAAGRALVRLTMESEPNCKAIAMADESNLKALRSMVLGGGQPNTAHGAVAANVLRNLCAYLELEPGNRCQDTMKEFARANILTVLEEICKIDNVLGEDMEAFLGLALQFGRLISAPEFSAKLNANTVDPGNFVQKLVSVLSHANEPPADRRPAGSGTRRSAIELAVWMLRSEHQLNCIQHFVSRGTMRAALTTAQQQVSVEENYKLLAATGVPVLVHEESLSALVKTALRLLPA